jgi:hypothetical protein
MDPITAISIIGGFLLFFVTLVIISRGTKDFDFRYGERRKENRYKCNDFEMSCEILP